jgi:hypothetical protein
LASLSDTVCASGFPADDTKRSDSGAAFAAFERIVYGGRDGIPTLFGYDYGRKGKPDRWVPVNPPHQ